MQELGSRTPHKSPNPGMLTGYKIQREAEALQTVLALTNSTLQQLLSGGRMDTWTAPPVCNHPQGTICWRTYFPKLMWKKTATVRAQMCYNYIKKIKSSIVTPYLDSTKRCIHNTMLVPATVCCPLSTWWVHQAHPPLVMQLTLPFAHLDLLSSSAHSSC